MISFCNVYGHDHLGCLGSPHAQETMSTAFLTLKWKSAWITQLMLNVNYLHSRFVWLFFETIENITKAFTAWTVPTLNVSSGPSLLGEEWALWIQQMQNEELFVSGFKNSPCAGELSCLFPGLVNCVGIFGVGAVTWLNYLCSIHRQSSFRISLAISFQRSILLRIQQLVQ